MEIKSKEIQKLFSKLITDKLSNLETEVGIQTQKLLNFKQTLLENFFMKYDSQDVKDTILKVLQKKKTLTHTQRHK